MPKIIFRADGNSRTGLGHLYRAFALYEMFRSDYNCLLLTRENSTVEVIPEGYNYRTIPVSVQLMNEPAWINEKYKPGEHALILDGYDFNSDYQKALKNYHYTLAYVDDFSRGEVNADIIINHALSVKSSDYNAKPGTKFALGTHYAILRPLFLEAAKVPRIVKRINTAFVCFGGADPLNLSIKAVKALLKFEQVEKINLVIGAAYEHKEIKELELKEKKLKVYQNLSSDKLLKVMEESNFGIAPASNILYELCTVKMPLLSGYYVDNQKKIYQGCLDEQIIIDGGNFKNYGVEDFEKKIGEILVMPGYQKYIDAQSRLFDSKIKSRFLDLMKNLNYRRATEADMFQVFKWANDSLSRANSYFSEPIELETHKTWFEKKLKDKKSLMFIAEIDNKAAGFVRYDISETNAVVGIMVDEEFRGRGLATDFLKDSAKLFFKENALPILAYIKQQNSASVKSFERAGYKKLKEEIVQGSNSFVYILEKL